MITILKITCMYCSCAMGTKDGKGVSGISHGICRDCWTARFPDWPYPSPKDEPESGKDK